MKLKIKVGTTSKRIKVFIQDSSSTTGAGLTGLVFNSAGLKCFYIKDGDSATTGIDGSTGNFVTATLGTFVSGGFKEVDATNFPGVYEIGIPNAALASGNCTHIFLRGATNMAPCPIEIELDAVDYQDNVRFGLTSLPNVASGSAGALLTSGSGTAQLATSGGLVTLAGVTHTGAVIPTVTDVTTKTGYSLTQAFPANFASMALSVGGSVTVGTNSDKAGYSLVAGTGLGNQTANLTGNVSGSVGSVTGLTVANLDATISSRASATNLATVASYIDTEIAAIQAKTDLIPASPAAVSDIPTTSAIATAVAGTQVLSRLDSMIEANGSGQFRFDTIALELAPTGGGGGGGATDWTVDERTAIRSILGIPGSGTTPADPTVGILDAIRDQLPDNFAALEINTDGEVLLQPLQPGVTIPTVTTVSNAVVLPTIPTAWVTADGIATDAIGAAEISASAVTKIQTGLLASESYVAPDNATIATIDTAVGLIIEKTNLIPSEPASRTNITAASGVTVSAIGSNAITADAIAADAGTELANALLDLANGVETSTTLRQAIRLIVAAAAGKVNGAAGSTVNIRNLADTLNRITATVDADGNRTAITTNLG